MNLHKQLGMDPNNKKTDYMKLLEKELSEITEKGIKPRLLLHSCCAPCSSYVLEYLREFFEITVFYYNPNITANEEYDFRLSEEKRLIEEYNRQVEAQDFTGMHSTQNAEKIGILEAPYDPERYLEAVKGLEDCPEGGDGLPGGRRPVRRLLCDAAGRDSQSSGGRRIRLFYDDAYDQSA